MINQENEPSAAAWGFDSPGDLVGRPYAGESDLPLLEALLAACAEDEPVEATRMLLIRANPGEHLDADTSVARLWVDDAAPEPILFACAVVTGNVPRLAFHVRPDARTPVVEAAVMAWVEEQLPGVAATATARLDVHLRPDGDGYRAALLERHGFTRVESVLLRFRRSLAEPTADPELPPGYRVRPLRGADELDAFLALFREAYGAGPTRQRREEVWRRPLHVPELVVEAPDDRLVAFCYVDVGALSMMPLAPGEGCVAQFGCARGYPYQEFTRAAFRAGLHELRRRGMTAAKVQAGSRNEKELILFAAEGFQPTELLPLLRYEKSAGKPVAAPAQGPADRGRRR